MELFSEKCKFAKLGAKELVLELLASAAIWSSKTSTLRTFLFTFFRMVSHQNKRSI